ncbi:MAG: YacL family protein [bacterium]
MSDIKFFRDDDKAPRAEADNPHLAALAQFLESDIQDDPETCTDLITMINDHSASSEEALEVIGNSYSLTFDGDTVTLDCLACEEDDIFTLPTETVRDSLEKWLAFIR